jgi:hypothetical protein
VLVQLRRIASTVAVVLVGLSLVVLDPNGPSAMAAPMCSGSSLCESENAWVLAELASNSAPTYTAVANAANAAGNTLVGGSTAAIPVAAGTTAATASTGLSLSWAGLGKTALMFGGSAGLLVGLGGDGAPDPSVVLPNGGPVEQLQPGWTERPYSFWTYGGQTSSATVSAQQVSASTVTVTWTNSGTWSGASASIVGVRCGVSFEQPNTWDNYAQWQVTSPGSPRTVTCGGTKPALIEVFMQRMAGTTSIAATHWYPTGHPSRPADQPDQSADALKRQVTTRTQCKDPSGGGTVIVSVSQTFTLSMLKQGFQPTVPEAQCPENMWAAETAPNVVTTLPDGGTVETPLSAPVTMPQGVAEAAPSVIAGTHPGLQLRYRVDGVFQPCQAGSTACRGWWTNPQRDAQYQCQANGVVVALAACAVYRDLFEPTPTLTPTPTDTNPAPSDPEGNACWPKGWGLLNPLEWVYRPLVCAGKFLFAPADGTMAAWQEFVEDVSGRAPISHMINGVEWIDAAADGARSGGSCADAPTEMGDTQLVPASFDLCRAAVTVRHTTWGEAVYTVASAGIVGGGLFIAWKRIARSFGGKS